MEAVVATDASARRIGLSNVSPEQLMDIISFVRERIESGIHISPPPRYPDALQSFADPIFPDHALRHICQEYGIEFVSYSTLGSQHQGRMIRGMNNPVLEDRRIRRLAHKYQRSTAEVVLSWAVQRNMSVIPRSNTQLHIEQLARLLTNATFVNEEDLELIDGLEYRKNE
jgi:diketogulonate reductase-like aldo/keto reductase